MDFMPVHLVGQVCSSSDYLFFTRRNAPGFSENLGSFVWGASWLQLLQALCDVGSSACLGGAAHVAFQALWHTELRSGPLCRVSGASWCPSQCAVFHGAPRRRGHGPQTAHLACLQAVCSPQGSAGRMQGPPLLWASAQLRFSHQPEGLSPL